MDTAMISELLREGVWVVIKVCGPMLLLSMLMGVLMAMFQALCFCGNTVCLRCLT